MSKINIYLYDIQDIFTDGVIKQSPNSSVGAIETKIVYNNNKSQTWLDCKANTDKKIFFIKNCN